MAYYYNNPAPPAARKLWEPPTTLSITLLDDKQCVGWAPSMGRKCHNQIAIANRTAAGRCLDELATLNPLVDPDRTTGCLRRLARFALCLGRGGRGIHRDSQVESMVVQWWNSIAERLVLLPTTAAAPAPVPVLMTPPATPPTTVSANRATPSSHAQRDYGFFGTFNAVPAQQQQPLIAPPLYNPTPAAAAARAPLLPAPQHTAPAYPDTPDTTPLRRPRAEYAIASSSSASSAGARLPLTPTASAERLRPVYSTPTWSWTETEASPSRVRAGVEPVVGTPTRAPARRGVLELPEVPRTELVVRRGEEEEEEEEEEPLRVAVAVGAEEEEDGAQEEAQEIGGPEAAPADLPHGIVADEDQDQVADDGVPEDLSDDGDDDDHDAADDLLDALGAAPLVSDAEAAERADERIEGEDATPEIPAGEEDHDDGRDEAHPASAATEGVEDTTEADIEPVEAAAVPHRDTAEDPGDSPPPPLLEPADSPPAPEDGGDTAPELDENAEGTERTIVPAQNDIAGDDAGPARTGTADLASASATSPRIVLDDNLSPPATATTITAITTPPRLVEQPIQPTQSTTPSRSQSHTSSSPNTPTCALCLSLSPSPSVGQATPTPTRKCHMCTAKTYLTPFLFTAGFVLLAGGWPAAGG